MKKIKNRLLRVLSTLFFLSLLLVLFWHSSQNKTREHELFQVALAQAENLEILVVYFYDLSGRVPYSLLDRLPDGRCFAELFPEAEVLTNVFTARRTEPRFFDRIYKEADRGTIAIAKEDGKYYILVYDNSKKPIKKRLRL